MEIQNAVPSLWRCAFFGRNPKRTLVRVCFWALGTNLIFHALFVPITVSGSSMAPTYTSGMRNLVNRLAYVRHAPRRGDVVVVDLGAEDGKLIKRIIAVPGETVSLARGRIEIDSRPLRDSHASAVIPWTAGPLRLKANEFFVIGDNRANSVFGLVTRDQILGKVLF